MSTKRTSLLAGAILGSALLLGTAGLALAQDPTSTPSTSPATRTQGDMMGGRGLMGGQGDMMGGRGMMGGQGMDAEDIAAMHSAMERDGACDPALVQSMHGQSADSR